MRGPVPVADSSKQRPSLCLRCRNIACQDGEILPWYSIEGSSPFLMSLSLLAEMGFRFRRFCAADSPRMVDEDEKAGENPRPIPKVLSLLLLSVDRKKGCVFCFARRSMALMEDETEVALPVGSGLILLLNDDDFGRGGVTSKRWRSIEGPFGFCRLAGRHTGLPRPETNTDDDDDVFDLSISARPNESLLTVL